jgi:tetratricopeptide (TPR) repeat protein
MHSSRSSVSKVGWAVLAAGLLLVIDASPTPVDGRAAERVDEPKSVLGGYLAGRFARSANDTSSAADFYRQALMRDPGSEVLIEQAFLMEATEARWPRAIELAEQLVVTQPVHRMGRMVLGIRDFKAKNFVGADESFRASGTNPIGELTSSLARAWVKLAEGDVQAALDLLDGGRQPEWARLYINYHRALIADVGGRAAEARRNYERVFRSDMRTPRTAMAYAQHLAIAGDVKLARMIVRDHLDKVGGDGHPMIAALRDRLDAGGKVEPLIATVDQGLAEVFYGLGEALSAERGYSIGVLYLQMALYVHPEFPFALAALANVHEQTNRYADAIEIYDRIPKGTPLELSIEIRKGVNLNLLERVDEAKHLLEVLAQAHPDDIKPLDALGTIMRARKRYAEAIDYYGRAIALIPKPDKRHWGYWYARGTSYERVKKWPQAEADLQMALKLNPDQPLVLNYLGYSWIDQSRNLKQGMGLIEKAVALKPDDGYIIDSLGWAHYRLGNFKDAVRYLERAVELRPEDPVLNDHLGDALWKVGRQREANFQWDQALTLNPEPEDAERIRKKLGKGLPDRPQAGVAKKKTKAALRTEVPKKRTETQLGRTPPIQ